MKTYMESFCKWLDTYLNFEKTPKKNIFWLDTMNFLAQRLGDPQKSCPSFHVAGSKGKGSVSAMITSILSCAGYRTGLYTSPHILNFTERVQSGTGDFPDSVYEKSIEELKKTVDSIPVKDMPGERAVTWFELVTLFAFLCFKNASCDYAVYEVGLGGRLDSTNIISPASCAIGPIELEHTEFLGNTLQAIASEKGGIIKENTPVFSAAQKEEVREVFRRIAEGKKAPLYFADTVSNISELVYKNRQLVNYNSLCFNNELRSILYSKENDTNQGFLCKENVYDVVKNNTFTMQFSIQSEFFNRPLRPSMQLLGSFQAQNAALAALVVKSVLPSLSEDVIELGLSKAKLPGRFELIYQVAGYPNIENLILDGAHTVNSVKNTMELFTILFRKNSLSKKKAYLLFAAASDKDVEDIAPLFKDSFDKIFLTRPGNVKQSDIQRLEKAFKNALLDFSLQEDFKKAIKDSLSLADKEGGILLVTGSFYLLAEVKKIIRQ